LDGTIDAQMAQSLASYVQRERAGIVADFNKHPPDVVLIDNQNSDWGDWARSDPEISALLAPYALVQTVDGIEILQRTRPPEAGVRSSSTHLSSSGQF